MLKSFFRLIRWPNLLIVALTQYFLYHYLLVPAFKAAKLSAILDYRHFSLLVLTTVLITAGGYIINDLTDFRIDLINKPHKVIINRAFKIQTVYWMYFCLNFIGFLVALYLALYVRNLPLVNIFPVAVAALFMYSLRLKKEPLIGNLLIAAFCAGVAGIVWFAERKAFVALTYRLPESAAYIQQLFVFYLLFAFLSTVFREIVKDIEDMEGDGVGNYRTLPLVIGAEKSKWVAMAFALLLALTLSYMLVLNQQSWGWEALVFAIGFIYLPLVIANYLLIRAKNKQQIRQVSHLAKFIMLSGILLLLILVLS
ncbi:MAG TPA: geranylgeranylglycerol-phosphate geranylgeranyltransferase [Saprospiraceae bacterium]|nr:geranylgeranylglycerol-phosphate geranylgeranyltransferase [Saprospiraceae bacterium]HMQ85669.1 geranylgeranylglycerol-phosphate geranylgeranyltransferase [Saprospiraceae bacterium]